MEKSIKMLMVLAASIITLAACNKEEKDITVQGEKETFTVNFTANTDATKSHFGDKTDGKYPTYWDEGDKVAVLAIPMSAQGQPLFENLQEFAADDAPALTPINEGKNARFSVLIPSDVTAEGGWLFAAMSPSTAYKEFGTNDEQGGRPRVKFTVPTVQTPLENNPDPAAQILTTEPATSSYDVTTGTCNVNLAFHHNLIKYFKITLLGLPDDAVVSGLKLVFNEGDKGEGVAGDFWYNFPMGPELPGFSEVYESTETITVNTSAKENIWVVMFCDAAIEDKSVEFTVKTNKGDYTKTVTFPAGYDISAGQVASFSLNFAGIEPVVTKNTYVKVTSNLSDWSGEYLIVSEHKERIADTKLSSYGFLTTTTDFILSDDGASIDADPQNQFTISPASDGKYYITNAAGEYLHLPDFNETAFGYTSDLSGAPAGYAQWSLSIAQSGKAVINYGIVGNSQRNIGDNGDRDFRGYAGGSFCYLYKNIGASGKTHQTLSFPEESYQVGVDDTFTAPELSGAQTTVTYESSETSVATVDPSTGAITIVGPGSTVITATAEETDSYYSASASYTLTVVGNDCYVKVEANQSDWSGQYLIVYEGGDTPLAFNGGLATLDAISNYIEVTIDGKTIAKTAETTAAEFTIAPKSGASAGIYSLKSASGKYISGTTVNAEATNGMKSSTSDADYEITFSYSNSDGLSIFSKSSDQNMVLRYNNGSNQNRFRFYKSGQQPVALYKYNGAQKETQTISFAEQEISWTVGTDCTFETAKQGQTVTGAQTTVTYSSSDSEVATVANDGKVTPHKAGTVTITATAAEDDTYASATATYTLNIVGNTDYSGDYVIIYATATEKYAMPAYTSGNNIKGITYTLNAENKITADDIDQCKYEIRKVTEGTLAGKYTIKDVNGLYIYAAGDIGDNYLKAAATPSTDNRYYWTISQNGDVFDIIAASSNNNELRFNDNSGSKLFSCYASTSSCEKVSLVPWSNVHVDTTPRIIVAEADKTQNVAAAGKTITIDCTLKNITGTLGIAKTDADDIIEGTPTYANGNLTIVVKENTESVAKTATVTLSYDGATSVVITINQDAKVVGGDEYQKYTGTLVEGDYVIYYSGKAMKNTVSSSRLDYVEVTPQNDKIVNPDAGIVWHIAPSGSYWTIYNASAAKYAASTGTKNQAALSDSGTDDKSLWTASGTSTYEFVNKKNFSNSVNANLRNNGTYGFACYATGTGGALTLYKKVSDGPTPQPTKLATPSPSFSNNTVSWSAIADAQGYKVKVGAGEEISVSETSYSLSSLAAGTYSVTVKAVGNGTTTTDSDWSSALSCTVTGGSTGDNTFEITSAAIVSNSAYAKYEGTVDDRNWIITFGGNNKSVGTNSGNRSKCILENYSKYAVFPVTTSDIASAFASTTKIDNVKAIKYTIGGGSNQTSTNVYLIYSSDGTTFSQIYLKKGTQGAAISSGTEFEFEKCSGYFALVFKATNSSGNWRIDDVNLTFTYE